MRLDGCSALITGASSGLGREFARELVHRANRLVLVARRAARLEELREELREQNPKLIVEIRPIDLRERSQITDLCAWLAQKKIAIDFLINNAGLGDHGTIASGDPARALEMIDVNIAALTQLTRALLPSMIERRHGAVLNVSSIAGFLPIPQMAIYAATKAYVTSFSEALRAELHRLGITVTALCPGPVQTEFAGVAERACAERKMAPGFFYVSADKVVQAGLNAVEKGRPISVPGAFSKFGMLLVRLMPMPLFRLLINLSPTR